MRPLMYIYKFVSGFNLGDLKYSVNRHVIYFSTNLLSSHKFYGPTSYIMERNIHKSSQLDADSAGNTSYAEALLRGKTQSEDSSNNNPLPSLDISNGNITLSDLDTDIKSDAKESKNSDLTNTSNSINDSFEDAEDSQLTFNSQVSKDPSSDCNVNSEENVESTASTPTQCSSGRNSNYQEMNEQNLSEEDSGEESDMEEEVNDLDSMYPTALKWKFRPTNPALALPETVTVLETNFGSKVYLVGTAHFSLESQEDVAKTIKAIQPDTVMIELCKSRINILSLDEATILAEVKGMSFQKIKATLEQNGFLQGVLYFLLLSMSVHLTEQLGMAPGGEFRRAYLEAQQIPGCMVHLGDRPIHITLQRALAKLSIWQKIRIAWHIMRSRGPITPEEIERCKNKDLLEEMLAEMTGEFPELSQVFVKERDIYLTYSLQMAALPTISPRNPEVPTPTTVVGIVGMGHVPGIIECWGKVKDEDIPPILFIPEPTLTSKVFRHSIRISVLGLAAFAVYKYFPKSIISNIKPWLMFNSNV